MPKTAEKRKIIQFLAENAINKIDFVTNSGFEETDNSTTEDEIDIIMDEVIDDIILVESCRRGVYNVVPKSMHWSLDILTKLDDNRFLQMLRVSRNDFDKLVSLICDDPEFNKPHSCEQFPVHYQLAIVLYRLGSSGEGVSLKKIAAVFGVGDGGTVDIITKRVFKAFLNLQGTYISWPDEEERSAIVAATYNELPFCVGYVDGTEIALAEAPVLNPQKFFSRTRQYSIKAQVICDYQCRIRNVVVGHEGSVHDSKIFKSCEIYKESQKYFSSHQWIAGDSAYCLSTTLITPYRSNSNQMDSAKRKRFNKKHARTEFELSIVLGI